MITKAVRLHGKKDLRLEEIELPQVGPDDVRVKVISDSVCTSTYKMTQMGSENVRVPDDIETNPIIIGHEFCGVIDEVGSRWKDKYQKGQGFAIQAAHLYEGSLNAPGFSYQYCGGDSQYANIPIETLIMDCLLPYHSDVYFHGSLLEPMSCIIRAFHAMYHTTEGSYEHTMGIKKDGKMALLASMGPMGLGAIDYALHSDRRPSMLVVTDIDEKRLERAESLFPKNKAKEFGIDLYFVNTSKYKDVVKYLRDLTDGTGFDDVISFAPIKNVMEQADAILGHDGCLNVFAGPTNKEFLCEVNFYNIHYKHAHLIGTAGGTTADMKEAIEMMKNRKLTAAVMITHIGGLDAVVETILNLPQIPGAKKLIYSQLSLPLTALDEFEEKGKTDPLFAKLDSIIKRNKGLWCAEAEKYLLEHADPIK